MLPYLGIVELSAINTQCVDWGILAPSYVFWCWLCSHEDFSTDRGMLAVRVQIAAPTMWINDSFSNVTKCIATLRSGERFVDRCTMVDCSGVS